MTGKAVSGNSCQVEMDGAVVGFVQGVTISEDVSPEPLSGIGSMEVQEWVPTMARYTVRVESATLGIDAAGLGKEMDIVLYSGGKAGKRLGGCTFANGSVNVRKHAIVISDATFYARTSG